MDWFFFLLCLERLCSQRRRRIPLDMKAQMQTGILPVILFTAIQSLHTKSDSPESTLHALAC